MDWDMDFTVRSHHKTKLIKQYKNYPKIHGQTRGGGGRTTPPPEYATGSSTGEDKWRLIGKLVIIC